MIKILNVGKGAFIIYESGEGGTGENLKISIFFGIPPPNLNFFSGTPPKWQQNISRCNLQFSD